MAKKMKALDWATIGLLVAGGLNWGLVSLFDFDLVTFITFGMSWLDTTVKALVGASGLYGLWFIIKQNFM